MMTAAPSLDRDLTPDLEQARRFLSVLAPGETRFTFQTYDDDKERRDGNLSVVLHGSLDQHAARLSSLNARGAAVCVMVNEGSGRSAGGVKRVRALFADFDNVPLGRADNLKRAPHLIVKSSPDKWHVYYRVEGVPIERFRAVSDRCESVGVP